MITSLIIWLRERRTRKAFAEIERATRASEAHTEALDLGPYLMAPTAPPSIASIQRAVCGYYGLSSRELLSGGRYTRVARPRQLAMFLARQMTSRTFPEIGRKFQRDHSTVIHAVQKTELRMHWDGDLVEDAAAIRAVLAHG